MKFFCSKLWFEVSDRPWSWIAFNCNTLIFSVLRRLIQEGIKRKLKSTIKKKGKPFGDSDAMYPSGQRRKGSSAYWCVHLYMPQSIHIKIDCLSTLEWHSQILPGKSIRASPLLPTKPLPPRKSTLPRCLQTRAPGLPGHSIVAIRASNEVQWSVGHSCWLISTGRKGRWCAATYCALPTKSCWKQQEWSV